MKRNKTQKGITLVALIITIIVLVILAVVAIRAVTGDGIIAHAKNARQQYEQAAEEENALLLSLEGYITSQSGSIKTGPLGEAINTENYGKKVVGYTSKGAGLNTLVWRVFYEDANNVYLISSIENEDGSKEYPISSLSFQTAKYNSGADVSSQGQALMPMASSLFTTDNRNSNIIATAYLCDTAVWDNYRDAAGKAAWAMGGPTIELFVKSYNACDFENQITLEINTNGYTDDTIPTYFTTGQKNGIYNLRGNGSKYIASPHNDGIYMVGEGSGHLLATDTSSNTGACPVVCIPRDNFNYTLAD